MKTGMSAVNSNPIYYPKLNKSTWNYSKFLNRSGTEMYYVKYLSKCIFIHFLFYNLVLKFLLV